MNAATWVAIYMPLVVIFLIVLPQERSIQNLVIRKIRMKREGIIMTNELIKKCIGKNCWVSAGSFGTSVVGKIIEVNENWIEIETKKGSQLINTEFVQSIKLDQK